MGLEILYVLIPVTLVLAAIALLLFVWAIQSGQFDDLETPAIRILFDDGPAPEREPPSATPLPQPRNHPEKGTE
ncbi:MAG TPA: cbb3-type cytochrome oxidase assembly protein CcoS [bacterium]|nr:cbb3-type cytochrome oxidase assembly protein CcoS [bacterium]